MELSSVETVPSNGRPRRKRTGKKRACFRKYPRPAIAVRGLWEHATEEERRKAHATCMVMLEYWLGRITKQQAAERLSVPGLRVWQMSQQALSGMLAGLLKQPRRGRPTERSASMDPGDDPKVLKKRIAELERKLATAEDLIRIFRDLPPLNEAEKKTPKRTAKSPPPPAGKKRRRKPQGESPSSGGGNVAPEAESSS